MKRKITYLVVVILVVLMLITSCARAEAPEQTKYLMGSTSTASSYYSTNVAFAAVSMKYTPNLHISVVETGASYDSLKKMQKGYLDLGGSIGLPACAEAYFGAGPFEGNPYKELRMWQVFTSSANFLYVRADSGVNTLSDLTGKKFSGGVIGSGPDYQVRTACEANGVEPDWYVGSLGDAIAAMKDGRIVGLVRSSTPDFQLTGDMLEVASLTKIKVISFTKGEMDKALAKMPGVYSVTVPAGHMTVLPEQGEVNAMAQGIASVATSAIPQDIIYSSAKAMHQHWKDEIMALSPPQRETDTAKRSYDYAAGAAQPVPLHSGLIQYLKELGYDVPASATPPEYKG